MKSSSSGKRQHHFSFDQLAPPPNTTVVIASILVERSGGGFSLRDMIDVVRRRAESTPKLVPHIDRVISMSLGNSWPDALEAKFDLEKAQSSLAFFRSETIPSIPTPLPPGVIRAEFESDLSNSEQLSPAALDALGGLFHSAKPHHKGPSFR